LISPAKDLQVKERDGVAEDKGFMKFIGVTQVAKPIVIFGGATMTYLGIV